MKNTEYWLWYWGLIKKMKQLTQRKRSLHIVTQESPVRLAL